MARLTVVGVFVLRIFQPAPGIADVGVDDSWHSAQDLLHPPEAASGKHSHLGLALPGDSRRGAAVRLLHFGSFHVSSPVSASAGSSMAIATTSLHFQSRVFPVIMASKRHTRSGWRYRCHSPKNSELTWSIGSSRSATTPPGC